MLPTGHFTAHSGRRRCGPARSLRECDVWWGLPRESSARRTTMYLRLTRARFDPALADQVVPLASAVRAAMRRLPGLQHNHQGIDRAAGTVAAVSVWDSAEHASFSRET